MQNPSPEQKLDLSKISDQEILVRLEGLSRTERKITHLVLCHINAVEVRNLYLGLGFKSLYQYLTQHLHYGESAAYDRMQAARVLQKNPEIASKIEEGVLNLSQLVQVDQSLKQERKAGKALSPESTQELLVKIENKSVFETEKILACELNRTPKAHQKVKPQKDNSVRIELTLTQEQYALLKKAQNLISHSVPENNLAEVITYLAQAYIKKIEGPQTTKAKNKVKATVKDKTNANNNAKASEKLSNQTPQQARESLTHSFREMPIKAYKTVRQKRKSLSIKIRRAVFQKAHHCCEYINPLTGKRCGSQFQLQIDHVVPLACGGTDEIMNLRALCAVCNRREAQSWGIKRPLL
jgi:hypothetical protein